MITFLLTLLLLRFPPVSAGFADPSFALVVAPPAQFWSNQLNYAAQLAAGAERDARKVRDTLFTCMSSILKERMSYDKLSWAPWADHNLEFFMSLTDTRLAKFLKAAPSTFDQAAFLVRLTRYVAEYYPLMHECLPDVQRLNFLEMSYAGHISAQGAVHHSLVLRDMFLSKKLVELYAVIDLYRLYLRTVSFLRTFIPETVYYPNCVEVELDVNFFKEKIRSFMQENYRIPSLVNKFEGLMEKYSPTPKLPSLRSVLGGAVLPNFAPIPISPASAHTSPVDVTSVSFMTGGSPVGSSGVVGDQPVRPKRSLDFRNTGVSYLEVLKEQRTQNESPERAQKRARNFFSAPLIENLRKVAKP